MDSQILRDHTQKISDLIIKTAFYVMISKLEIPYLVTHTTQALVNALISQMSTLTISVTIPSSVPGTVNRIIVF